MENLATPIGMILGKSRKKELDMKLGNTELLSYLSFSFTSRHFLTFLICSKMGKPSKSKLVLNSVFTVLALARFFLITAAYAPL